MQFKVPLRRKDKEIETTPCIVEKTIELSAVSYTHLDVYKRQADAPTKGRISLCSACGRQYVRQPV